MNHILPLSEPDRRRFAKKLLVLVMLGFLLAGLPLAFLLIAFQSSPNSPNPETLKAASDAKLVWLLVAAMLVFMMQIGFLAFESASVQLKNAQSVAIKNFLNLIVVWFGFILVGYGFMFGASYRGLGWLGTTRFAWNEMTNYEWCVLLYQSGFAAVTATIVSSAIVERSQITANVLVALFVGIIVFPLFGHWAWCPWPWSLPPGGAELFTQADSSHFHSIGWLNRLGFHDFAGSTVVHCVGGVAALAGALVVGPRNSAPLAFTGNLPLAAIGVLFLWIGWIGFNGGSIHSFEEVGRVIVNTNLSPIAAALTASLYLRVRGRRRDWNRILLGAMGGLVAITAGSLRLQWWEATLVGSLSGAITVEIALAFAAGVYETPESQPRTVLPGFAVSHMVVAAIGGLLLRELAQEFRFSDQTLINIIALCLGVFAAYELSRWAWRRYVYHLQIDDPVDAIAVHGVAGAFGTVMVGVLGHAPLVVQTGGVLVAMIWTFGISYALFSLLNRFGVLRVLPDEEKKGVGLSNVEIQALPFWADLARFEHLKERERVLAQNFRKYKQQSFQYMTIVSHQLLSPIRGAIERLRLVLEEQNANETPDVSSRQVKRIASACKFAEIAVFRATNMDLLGILEQKEELRNWLRVHPRKKFHISILITDIVDLLSDIAEFRKIVVNWKPPSHEILVRGHEELVRQAIANLIENAISYSDEGQLVKISITDLTTKALRGGRIVQVSVLSRGLPISADERTRIFERGYRSVNARTRRADGSGIGLYLVKRIASIEGGEVVLLSTPGDDRIAEFVVTLQRV